MQAVERCINDAEAAAQMAATAKDGDADTSASALEPLMPVTHSQPLEMEFHTGTTLTPYTGRRPPEKNIVRLPKENLLHITTTP